MSHHLSKIFFADDGTSDIKAIYYFLLASTPLLRKLMKFSTERS